MDSELIWVAAGTVASTTTGLMALLTARQANRTAKLMASIEHERRRGELVPEFRAVARIPLVRDPDDPARMVRGRRARLHLTLTGPKYLEFLDNCRIFIDEEWDLVPEIESTAGVGVAIDLDDPANRPTLAPYRFTENDSPRMVAVDSWQVGTQRRFDLERTDRRTLPLTDADWWRLTEESPVAVSVEARRRTHDQPSYLWEVSVTTTIETFDGNP